MTTTRKIELTIAALVGFALGIYVGTRPSTPREAEPIRANYLDLKEDQ